MNPRRAALVLTAVCSLLTAGCSSGFGGSGSARQSAGGKQHLTMLIASSGDAETSAVTAAVDAWSKQSGDTVTVVTAQNMDQQLGQTLAGSHPDDVFYLSPDQFANDVKGGSLYSYADQLSYKDDFSPALRSAFTYQGHFVCAPKDTSTLALVVNKALWQKAGLTAADYPTTWAQLESDAKRLTSGPVTGLVVDSSYNELGVFLRQAGGWLVDPSQTKVTADTPADTTALAFVQKLLREGVLKFPAQVDAGWGGEAFGKAKAAMTIEGNWITGAMSADYPSVRYAVVPLPSGPAGKGTLAFTNCWGIARKSPHHQAAVSLVRYLTSTRQQLAFARSFGVMPSRTSALPAYAQQFPAAKAFVDGVGYAQGPITIPGFDKVLTQFDSELAALATTGPGKPLSDLQTNGTQLLASGS